MKIILATCGSRGDVQPLIALGSGLLNAGHDVMICASPEHAAWVENYRLPFKAVGSNVMKFLETHSNVHSLKAITGFVRFIRQEVRVQLEKLPEIIAGADMVIGSSLLVGARTAAESVNVPYYYMVFCPQIIPSKHHPMLHVRNHRLPTWLNRFSWWFFKHLDANVNYRKLINTERTKHGLPPVSDVFSHLLGNHVIVATDPLLGTVPDDVKIPFTQTGYLHLDQQGSLPDDLEEFITAGSPPVFMGFGSMPSEDPQKTTQILLHAARTAGARVVLSRGWANLAGDHNDRDVYFANDLPHNRLFPQMAAVAHHGGAGTTANAAKAGVPQIIVPHITDQFYWGHQIHRKRLGPKPIQRSHLTAPRLAEAITACISDPVYAHTARNYSAKLNMQTPVENAIKVIEGLPR